MSITTASGAKIFIGPAQAVEPANAAAYQALAWVEVKEVETLGEFGDESSSVDFAAIGDGRVRKLKGARDAGTIELTCGRDPLDAGQLAIKAAEKTKFQYAFKIVAADAPTEEYNDSEYYFLGLVMSARENYGENDNVVRTTFNIGINTAITEISAFDPA